MPHVRILSLCLLLWLTSAISASEITGFWQTVHKKTKQPTSVIAVYLYEGKYYGKIIATYDEQGVMSETIYHPVTRAPGVSGHPYYCGLDIVEISDQNGSGTYKGHVMDPRKGKVYKAKLWREGNDLILRGEVLMFGRNVVWPPFPEGGFTATFQKPDLMKLVPQNSISRN